MTLNYEFSDKAQSLEENYEHIDQKITQDKLKAENDEIDYCKGYKAFFDALRLSQQFEITPNDMKKVIIASIEATNQILKAKKEQEQSKKASLEKEEKKQKVTEIKNEFENQKRDDEKNAPINYKKIETTTENMSVNNLVFSSAEKANKIEIDELNEKEAKIINTMLTGEEAYKSELKKISTCKLTEQNQLKENKKTEQNELEKSTQEERSQLREIKKEHLEHIRKNLLYSYRTKSYNKQYLEKILIPNLKDNVKYNITILSLSGLKLSNLIRGHNTTDQYLEQKIFKNIYQNIDQENQLNDKIFSFNQSKGYKIYMGGGDIAYIQPENQKLKINEKFEENNNTEEILKYAVIRANKQVEKDQIQNTIKNMIERAKNQKDNYKKELFNNDQTLTKLLKQCLTSTVTKYYETHKNDPMNSQETKKLLEKQVQAMLEIKNEYNQNAVENKKERKSMTENDNYKNEEGTEKASKMYENLKNKKDTMKRRKEPEQER